MKKIILFLIIIAGITAGCKKYPDGPMISFRSTLHRLYGYYNVKQYTINGVDSLSMLNDSIPCILRLWHDPYDEVNDCHATRYIGIGKGYDFASTNWALSDNKKEISFSYDYTYTSSKNITWTILKLTNKETKWTVTNNGKIYIIDLIKYAN